MQTTVILTLLGQDRSGLVERLADVLKAHHANWQESRMIHLGGQFAGLLQIRLPSTQLSALKTALAKLEQAGLRILIESDENDHTPRYDVWLEVLGQDRTGIVYDISQQLANLHVNIEQMFTEQRSASMSGETLFYAKLHLSLPANMSADQVQTALESLSDQLMIDFYMNEPDNEYSD
ncbi:MAG: glycine cleavage system protein R [bacterium]